MSFLCFKSLHEKLVDIEKNTTKNCNNDTCSYIMNKISIYYIILFNFDLFRGNNFVLSVDCYAYTTPELDR